MMYTRTKGSLDPHLSVYQARKILQCPRQWKYQYIDKIEKPETGVKLWKGKAFDGILNAYYTGDINYDRLLAEAEEDVRRAVQQVLTRYAETEMESVQKYHSFMLDDEILVIGYSDAITTSGVVIDHKYGGKPNNAPWRLQCEKQVATYWLADHVDTPGWEGWGRIVCATPANCTSWTFPITEHLVGLAIKDLRDAWELIKSKKYPPTPSMACGWCRWNEECVQELKERYDFEIQI